MSKKQNCNDTFLVERLQSGDRSALAVLVKKWHKLFCEKSYWLVKDKDVAKDIAQDSWMTIINKINKLKNPERFKYWAFRIVINKSMDYLRTSASKQITDNYQNQTSDVDEETDREQLKKLLSEAILRLPEEQKSVIQLFYTQNYSLKQISELLNISVGTVKSRLFHAREKLKTTLKIKRYEN